MIDRHIAARRTQLVPLHGLAHHATMLAGIIWTLLRQPIEASPDQIRQFAALYAANARPAQGRNRRYPAAVELILTERTS